MTAEANREATTEIDETTTLTEAEIGAVVVSSILHPYGRTWGCDRDDKRDDVLEAIDPERYRTMLSVEWDLFRAMDEEAWTRLIVGWALRARQGRSE